MVSFVGLLIIANVDLPSKEYVLLENSAKYRQRILQFVQVCIVQEETLGFHATVSSS